MQRTMVVLVLLALLGIVWGFSSALRANKPMSVEAMSAVTAFEAQSGRNDEVVTRMYADRDCRSAGNFRADVEDPKAYEYTPVPPKYIGTDGRVQHSRLEKWDDLAREVGCVEGVNQISSLLRLLSDEADKVLARARRITGQAYNCSPIDIKVGDQPVVVPGLVSYLDEVVCIRLENILPDRLISVQVSVVGGRGQIGVSLNGNIFVDVLPAGDIHDYVAIHNGYTGVVRVKEVEVIPVAMDLAGDFYGGLDEYAIAAYSAWHDSVPFTVEITPVELVTAPTTSTP